MIVDIKELEKQKTFLQNHADQIMNIFDFEKVHSAMAALNWQWVIMGTYVIPNISSLKDKARYLLEKAIEAPYNKYDIKTGGFVVHKDKNYIELRFELCSVDSTWLEDYCE